MRNVHNAFAPILATFLGLTVAGSLKGQTPLPSGKQPGQGIVWTEEFDGSSNVDGQVMTLLSTTGYNFNPHFGVVGGAPVYFVRDTSGTGTTRSNGIGDLFGGIRFAFANPAINYRTSLIGTAPTGDSTKGFGAGHPGYDWTNHFDRDFGRWTPYAELGLADSIPNTFIFQRQFTSYGSLGHFAAGTRVNLVGPLSASASAYDLVPWGTQTVYSRIARNGAPAGPGSHGRAFETSQKTIGGASLTRDDGFGGGLDARFVPALDLWIGFSHSVHLDLNTVSFGIGVNLSNLLHRSAN